MKKILLLLFITLSFSGCEKDDICTEDTTPQVVIDFYDVSNPTVPKNVTGLLVTGIGETTSLTFSGTNEIKLPLKISEDVTTYRMKIYSDSPNYANEDLIQFNYSRQNVYVSRACGYKTVFTLNDTNGVTRSDSDNAPDGFWIKAINITNKNVNSGNETHLKIYF